MSRGVAMLGFILAAWLAGPVLAGQPPPSRPNVIVILSDQHRWQAMSFTETPEVRTPNLERLAKEGFSASNFVSNYPLCSPARAIFLTGRWPRDTGVVDNSTKEYARLSPDVPNLGKLFAAAGYDTGYVGKWHLGNENEDLSAFGFRHSIVWTRTNDHWNSRYLGRDGKRHTSTRYNGSHMTDQFLEFVSEERKVPFFGVLSWNLPHSSYIDPPPEIRKSYARTKTPPWRENWSLPDSTDAESVGGGHYRGYHGHITAIDGEIARIRGRLEAMGIAGDTLLVYLSDHGAMLRSQGLLGKRVPYAESVKVPFLAVWPGEIATGSSSAAPLGMIDFVPTLCGLVGIACPADLPGSDFSHALRGATGPLPDSQFLMNIEEGHRPEQQPGPSVPFHRGVTTERYTYAVTPEGPWLLFDNQADPLQQKNLVADPEYARLREDMHGLLRGWIERTQDPFVLPEPAVATAAASEPAPEARAEADSAP